VAMVNEHICYNLNVEWHSLNMMFTHRTRGQTSELFDNNSLLRFINSSESAFPFVFRNVIYNSIDFNAECLSNVNNYIDNYINYETVYSLNFLATSPDDKTRIIIRDRDLLTFPKYFEGYKIETITSRTDQKHLNQFTSIHHHQFANIGIHLSFAELVEFTLMMRMLLATDYVPSDYLELLKLDFFNRGILIPYMENCHRYDQWEHFCYSLLYHYNYTCNSNEEYSYSNRCIQALLEDHVLKQKLRIDQIQNLKKYLDNIELFCEKFDGFKEQEELFVGMPIKLDRRSIFYTL
jgi:hypothetical protein